jgi:rhodanese-related sulfurtransferase
MNRRTLVRLVVSTLAALALALSARGALAAEDAKYPSMTPAEVKRKLSTKEFFVFDNNKPEVYAEGHIPGAFWLNPAKIGPKDLPPSKDATLLFYCASEQCTTCHLGAQAAIKLGYKKVFIMPAGIAGWKKAGFSLESAAKPAPAPQKKS